MTDSGLALSGIIDHQSIPGLISKLPDSSDIAPSVDLSRVDKIDSAGFAFLIHWGNQHIEDGQKLKLTGVNEQARQLISIMGLETVFDLAGID